MLILSAFTVCLNVIAIDFARENNFFLMLIL